MLRGFHRGALVDRRIILCGVGVGAFVLTLAFYSWQDGLWRSDAAPTASIAAQPRQATAMPTAEAAPAAAAMNPPPAIAPQEPVQSAPYSTLDVDNGEREDREMLARRDRGTERGSRSH